MESTADQDDAAIVTQNTTVLSGDGEADAQPTTAQAAHDDAISTTPDGTKTGDGDEVKVGYVVDHNNEGEEEEIIDINDDGPGNAVVSEGVSVTDVAVEEHPEDDSTPGKGQELDQVKKVTDLLQQLEKLISPQQEKDEEITNNSLNYQEIARTWLRISAAAAAFAGEKAFMGSDASFGEIASMVSRRLLKSVQDLVSEATECEKESQSKDKKTVVQDIFATIGRDARLAVEGPGKSDQFPVFIYSLNKEESLESDSLFSVVRTVEQRWKDDSQFIVPKSFTNMGRGGKVSVTVVGSRADAKAFMKKYEGTKIQMKSGKTLSLGFTLDAADVPVNLGPQSQSKKSGMETVPENAVPSTLRSTVYVYGFPQFCGSDLLEQLFVGKQIPKELLPASLKVILIKDSDRKESKYAEVVVVGNTELVSKFKNYYHGKEFTPKPGTISTLKASMSKTSTIKALIGNSALLSGSGKVVLSLAKEPTQTRSEHQEVVKKGGNTTTVFSSFLPTNTGRRNVEDIWKHSNFSASIGRFNHRRMSTNEEGGPAMMMFATCLILGDREVAKAFINRFNNSEMSVQAGKRVAVQFSFDTPDGTRAEDNNDGSSGPGPAVTRSAREPEPVRASDPSCDPLPSECRVFFYGLPKTCTSVRVMTRFLENRTSFNIKGSNEFEVTRVVLLEFGADHKEHIVGSIRNSRWVSGYIFLKGAPDVARRYASKFSGIKGVPEAEHSLVLMKPSNPGHEAEENNAEEQRHSAGWDSAIPSAGRNGRSDSDVSTCREGECRIKIEGFSNYVSQSIGESFVRRTLDEKNPIRFCLATGGMGWLFFKADTRSSQIVASKYNGVTGPNNSGRLRWSLDLNREDQMGRGRRRSVDLENRRRRRSRSYSNDSRLDRRRSPPRVAPVTTVVPPEQRQIPIAYASSAPTVSYSTWPPVVQEPPVPMMMAAPPPPLPAAAPPPPLPTTISPMVAAPPPHPPPAALPLPGQVQAPPPSLDPQAIQQQYEAYLRAVQMAQFQQHH